MSATTDLSQFDNSDYQPGPLLKRAIWYFINAFFFNSWFPFYNIKRGLLRLFGAKIGKGVIIKPYVRIKYPWRLSIGDYSWIGENVWIDNLDDVRIGKNCCISQGVTIICGNHRYDKIQFDLFTKPIVIEDGAWIGAKCVLLPGSMIQSHAVLNAGITFSGKAEANMVYAADFRFSQKPRHIQ
jgi:putative colanic acid biosynthesis acetyltransferase WcaF